MRTPFLTMTQGGLITYTANNIPAVIAATANFSANNTDLKAQIIPTFNTILTQVRGPVGLT